MSDLVSRDHQEQSAEHTPSQGEQDQDGGPQAPGEEHAGEPDRDGHKVTLYIIIMLRV